MTKSEVLNHLSNVKKWRQGDVRAPHKPLLLLMYFARLSRGIKTPLSFLETEEKLKELLMEFGPSRKSYHPEEPFARLTNDGIWLLDQSVNTKGSVSISELRQVNPAGRLIPPMFDLVVKDSSFLQQCVDHVLHEHFPESIHEEILHAIGFTSAEYKTTRKKRDPKFRDKVLIAYEYTCAVCGFNLRLKNASAGVEAAHVKWHAMNGPDDVSNGIALCTMHHKLFDLGAMGLDSYARLVVSPLTNGVGKELWLNSFEGKEINRPQKKYSSPSEEYLDWHAREVFKGDNYRSE